MEKITGYLVDDEYFDGIYNVDGSVYKMSEYINKLSNDSCVVIGFYDYKRAKLIEEKYKGYKFPVYDIQFAWLSNEPIIWNREFVEDNRERFCETQMLFHEQKSKEIMAEYIEASLTGDLSKLFEKYNDKEQYFNEITNSYDIETYVDCGAYDGDSIIAFLKKHNEVKKIIAYEPDEYNAEKLLENIKLWGLENKVKLIRAGAYSNNTKLFFLENDSSSAFCDIGEKIVYVEKIDNLINEKISFIKMDIEGAELEALCGAKDVITKYQPCLAICVYHKVEDLITIPQYICSLVPEGTYKYYLRHHGKNLTELVFYAVPCK